ncbi:MAG TPA: hypothetical protein VN634_11475 [Candidatus Limnocylindrales bacterium]|nr:hypothetical protein [Candidatus Limnocylindrales bacterium]
MIVSSISLRRQATSSAARLVSLLSLTLIAAGCGNGDGGVDWNHALSCDQAYPI